MEKIFECLLPLMFCITFVSAGILYPQESETREVKSLDGIWKFTTSPQDNQDLGFSEKWFLTGLRNWIDMPVPASYNDITVDAYIRDYVGWVWYQREFFVPKRWLHNNRVFIRFGSVHYTAIVWINDKLAVEHMGGHLPFQAEVTNLLNYGASNTVIVSVNNTLTLHTIPQGTYVHTNDTDLYPEGYVINSYNFDFFNYAGIHRPVVLYTVPQVFIDDVTVYTEVDDGGTASITYDVIYDNTMENMISSAAQCKVTVLDGSKVVIPAEKGCSGKLYIKSAKLWWPVFMSENPGHRYTLRISLFADDTDEEMDVYSLNVGIRSLYWDDNSFLINNRTIYFRGFGKHEDSDIRGKGLDYPVVIRDYNLIDWIGANSFRTSHYPYAEEIMELADMLGIMVVDESPAVNLDNFDDVLLEEHKRVMTELIQRDKNRACVIMWSVSNEARTQREEAGPHYREVVNHTRSLDGTRPITFATNQRYDKDNAAQYMDIIGINKYPAWYSDTGMVQLIPRQVVANVRNWNRHFNKTIFVTEYGADAIAGLHKLPSFVWTEDYQVEVMFQHFKAFDKLRKEGIFIGEMIWNFADFATRQDYTRVVGNHKGLFTRDRQPKASAHILRNRYRSLAEELDNHSWPTDNTDLDFE